MKKKKQFERNNKNNLHAIEEMWDDYLFVCFSSQEINRIE